MKRSEENWSGKNIRIEHRKFAKNAIYSLFNNYGIFIFQIIVSFFIARLISQEIWGILILALTYINIISLILTFFPPALTFSVNYYIPRYITLNKNYKLKSIIKVAFYIKSLFSLIIFSISVLIFSILHSFFSESLQNYTHILFLLSPLIIIIGLNSLLDSIYQGFSRYKLIFFLTILKFSFNIFALIICLIFGIKNLEIIALVNLISYIIPFLYSLLLFLKLYINIKYSNETKVSFKRTLSKLSKYGTPLSVSSFLNEIWKQFQAPIIEEFEPLSVITGFTLSKYYSHISLTAASSFSNPLITSFSTLDVKNEKDQINQIYNMTFKYSLFLMLLISGSLFILTDFFLVIVYGNSYLIYSSIVKLYLISVIFTVLGNILIPLLNAKNKVKILPILTIINLIIIISLFFIGIIFYGIIGAIFGMILSNIIVFLIQLFLSIKIGDVKIKLNKIFYQYINFFISLVIAVILEEFLFKTLRLQILLNLNLLFFQNLQIMSLISFLIIFLLLNRLIKIFSPKEIEALETLLTSDKIQHRIIQKILKMLKKIL
ncbi:MAG: lipopolysaccharide biosynthesis protein [Promethearchaeota archaeon]